MKQDTLVYDSLHARPLPKWLTDQRDGLNRYQPEISEMKEDHSLRISMITTGTVIILTVIILTVYFIYRNRKRRTNESV
jgi:heme/copper-type cytochrome/quinol oxidase subunit 2